MSSRLERVQAFADATSFLGSVTGLDMLMSRTAREFGADYFLMIHHADFSRSGEGL